MCPCPHGFANENLCNLCHSGQEVKTHSPKKRLPKNRKRIKGGKNVKFWSF